jgi:hypothetical protein
MSQVTPATPGLAPPARPQISDAQWLLRFASVWFLVVDLLLIGYSFYLTGPRRAYFLDIFRGMGAQLPSLTVAMLAVPTPVCWLLLGALAAGLTLAEALVRNRKATLLLHTAFLILLILAILLFWAAFEMPIVSLMQTVR